MARPEIECVHLNHINAMVEEFDESVSYTFAAQRLDYSSKPDCRACLINIGGIIFELFVPHQMLLHARYGPHYVGIEFVVPDVDAARQAMRNHGTRIVRELGAAFHTHAADGFGVSIECYDRSFHDVPPPVPYFEALKPISYWRDDHPLGLTGLKRITVAVRDLAAARPYFLDFLGGTTLYEADRPSVGAEAVGVAIADIVVELISPRGEGAIEQHLNRYGDGIRSTVFAVSDLAAASRYLVGCGVSLSAGDAPQSVAILAPDNRGLMFEFENSTAGVHDG